MHVDWGAVLQGIIVSWPGTAVMVWAAHARTRRHVDRATRAQNALFEDITAAQTSQIIAGETPPGVERE